MVKHTLKILKQTQQDYNDCLTILCQALKNAYQALRNIDFSDIFGGSNGNIEKKRDHKVKMFHIKWGNQISYLEKRSSYQCSV